MYTEIELWLLFSYCVNICKNGLMWRSKDNFRHRLCHFILSEAGSLVSTASLLEASQSASPGSAEISDAPHSIQLFMWAPSSAFTYWTMPRTGIHRFILNWRLHFKMSYNHWLSLGDPELAEHVWHFGFSHQHPIKRKRILCTVLLSDTCVWHIMIR